MWKLAMGHKLLPPLPLNSSVMQKKFTVSLTARSQFPSFSGQSRAMARACMVGLLLLLFCCVGKVSNCFLIQMFHSYGLVLLIAVVREASVFSGWDLTQSPYTSSSCWFSDCPALALKSVIAPSQTRDHGRKVSGKRIWKLEDGRGICEKLSSGHGTGNLAMAFGTLWVPVEDSETEFIPLWGARADNCSWRGGVIFLSGGVPGKLFLLKSTACAYAGIPN